MENRILQGTMQSCNYHDFGQTWGNRILQGTAQSCNYHGFGQTCGNVLISLRKIHELLFHRQHISLHKQHITVDNSSILLYAVCGG